MKKLITLFLIICILSALTACTATDPSVEPPVESPVESPTEAPEETSVVTPFETPFETPSESVEAKLKQDYCDFLNASSKYSSPITPDMLHFDLYFDRFDKFILVMFDCYGFGYDEACRDIFLGEVHIWFPNGQMLYVYTDGEFRTLSEAYDDGIITDKNAAYVKMAIDQYRGYP